MSLEKSECKQKNSPKTSHYSLKACFKPRCLQAEATATVCNMTWFAPTACGQEKMQKKDMQHGYSIR